MVAEATEKVSYFSTSVSEPLAKKKRRTRIAQNSVDGGAQSIICDGLRLTNALV